MQLIVVLKIRCQQGNKYEKNQETDSMAQDLIPSNFPNRSSSASSV